jgi:hypothetical protein
MTSSKRSPPRFLASTVVVPPDVAEHLNTDAMSVLAVIQNEAQASGKCSLPVARIAERANIGRAKARAAIRLAEGLGIGADDRRGGTQKGSLRSGRRACSRLARSQCHRRRLCRGVEDA